MSRIYFWHKILLLNLFYTLNYCKLYFVFWLLKIVVKIYFTVNPFDFGLYETSKYCSTSRIFLVSSILPL
jgi:hypothetical protein